VNHGVLDSVVDPLRRGGTMPLFASRVAPQHIGPTVLGCHSVALLSISVGWPSAGATEGVCTGGADGGNRGVC
jgi:hypothetical protein